MSKREMPEPEPLNLVPIMNLVTILIPVLLMAIKSLELAVIDTSLPAISPSVTTPPDNIPDKPPLSLKMAVTNQGIRILGANEYLYPGQVKTDDADEEKVHETSLAAANPLHTEERRASDFDFADIHHPAHQERHPLLHSVPQRRLPELVVLPRCRLALRLLPV